MDDLLRISEAANLALHTAVHLAQNSDRRVSASEVAEAYGASKAHLFKVLQRLVKAGFVKATRGPKGGYRLTRKPETVSLLQIYEAVDGKIRPSHCLFTKKVCSQEKCVMGKTLEEVNRTVTDHFSQTKLSEFL
ncbi:MAG: RrF2 family transcriptional regulator [Planctomycetota bacterium]|jgi:Rrf2 family protein